MYNDIRAITNRLNLQCEIKFDNEGFEVFIVKEKHKGRIETRIIYSWENFCKYKFEDLLKVFVE